MTCRLNESASNVMELGLGTARARRVTSFESRKSFSSLGGQGRQSWQDAGINDSYPQKEVLGNDLSAGNLCLAQRPMFWKLKAPLQQQQGSAGFESQAPKNCCLKDVWETLETGSMPAWKPCAHSMGMGKPTHVAQLQTAVLDRGGSKKVPAALVNEMAVQVPSPQLLSHNARDMFHVLCDEDAPVAGGDSGRLTSHHRREEDLMEKACRRRRDCDPGRLLSCGEGERHQLDNGMLEGWRSAKEAVTEPVGILNKPFYSRVEDIPVVLSRTDQKLKYTVVYNWDENYDWIPQSEWIGKTDHELMPGIEGVGDLYEHKFTCYRTGSVQKREICLADVPKYGTQVWLVMTWADVRSDSDVVGVYAACVEVTDIAIQREYLGSLGKDSPARRVALRKLERMVDMTAVALETRAACLASATFKIRAPLLGIFGAADALAAMGLTREQRGLLRLVRTSGEALLELARGALAQDVVVGGHIQVMNKVFRPGIIVERAVQDMLATAEWPGVSFDYEIDAQVPQKVVGDSLLLLQSLQILLRHVACRMMHSGNVCVRLRFPASNPSFAIEGAADSSKFGNFDLTRSPLPRHSPRNGRGGEVEGSSWKRQKVQMGGGGGGGTEELMNGRAVAVAPAPLNTPCDGRGLGLGLGLSNEEAATAAHGGEEDVVAGATQLVVDCQLSLAPPGNGDGTGNNQWQCPRPEVSSDKKEMVQQQQQVVAVGMRKRGFCDKVAESDGGGDEVHHGQQQQQPPLDENSVLLRFEVTDTILDRSIAEEPQADSGLLLEVPVPQPVSSELGLCRRLVRLMGGMLHAHSMRGLGPMYNFTIPFKTVQKHNSNNNNDNYDDNDDNDYRRNGSAPPTQSPRVSVAPRSNALLPGCDSCPNPHTDTGTPPGPKAGMGSKAALVHDTVPAAEYGEEDDTPPKYNNNHNCANEGHSRVPVPINHATTVQRGGGAGGGVGMKVLVIEKNVEDAASLTAILEQLGLHVNLVSSTSQALHALAASTFDMLLVNDDVARECDDGEGGVGSSLERMCVKARSAHEKGSGGEWLPIVAIGVSSLLGVGLGLGLGLQLGLAGGANSSSQHPSLIVHGVDAFIAKPATLYKVQVVVNQFLGIII